MTTIIDPSGSPSPVYNRSGTTVMTVVANGTTLGSATPIPYYSGETIVRIEASDDPRHTAVVLPDDAEIGDTVEAYATGYPAAVFAPTGTTIITSTQKQVTDDGARFRKVSATRWQTF